MEWEWNILDYMEVEETLCVYLLLQMAKDRIVHIYKKCLNKRFAS